MQNFGQLPQQDYEFSELENKTIGKAATWATALGILFFVQCAFSVFQLDIINAIVNLVVGIAFFKGGKAFKKVVDTEGNDLMHLMEALNRLSQAFQIRIVIVIIGVVIVAIAGVVIAAMAM